MTIGFRAKVLLAITLITTLSSMLIAAIFLNQSTKMVEESYIRSLRNMMSVSVKAFDDSIRVAYDTAITLSHDEKLIKMMQEYEDGGEFGTDALDLSAYLNSFYTQNSIIDEIYLYLPAKKQAITSLEYHAVQEIFYPEKYKWLTENQVRPAESGLAPKYMLTYRRKMYNGAGAQPAASIAVNLDERKLYYQKAMFYDLVS